MGEVATSYRWIGDAPVIGAGWRELGDGEAIAEGDLFQSTITTAIANNRWTHVIGAVGLTVAEAKQKWPSAMGRVIRREAPCG